MKRTKSFDIFYRHTNDVYSPFHDDNVIICTVAVCGGRGPGARHGAHPAGSGAVMY
jgi:hypothetical protein